MNNPFNDPVLQVMEDPNFDFGFDPNEAPPSSSGNTELPTLYPQYDGANDESSPLDTTASSSPTTRFSTNQTPNPNPNSRKRVRESLDSSTLTAENLAKSMKTTPSPALTGNTTPASFDTFDFSADPHMLNLLGGNPKDHLAEMLKEQREHEQAISDKKKQEENDAILARRMADQWELPPSLVDNSYPATSQSFLDSSGRIRRPHPSSAQALIPQSLPQSSFSSSPLQSNAPSSRYTIPKREKVGKDQLLSSPQQQLDFNLLPSFSPSSRQPTQPHQPPQPHQPQASHDIINLDSDDDDNFYGTYIQPFKDGNQAVNNNIHGMGATGPQWTKNTARENADGGPFGAIASSSSTGFDGYGARGFGGLGGASVYNAPSNTLFGTPSNLASWGDRMNGFGQSVKDMARGVLTSANELLSTQNPNQFDGLGSYSQPFPLSSSPDPSDLAFPLFPQSNIMNDRERLGKASTEYEEYMSRYRERYDYLTNDPTRTLTEIKDLLNNIRPDEDLPPENREGTPDAMVFPLMEHQKLGLTWMKSMEMGTNKGGILADGMGLGKTIQAIALMVSRKSTDVGCKTTLIIAPVALMKQWEREIQTKLKSNNEHRLKTYTLHGSGRQATWEDLKTYDVVLTTFGTLSTEVKRKAIIDHAKQTNPNWRPVTKADRLPLLGDECKWYRVIIDEAQCIKNRNTKAALGACALRSQTRFAMSGTPMQNNITELYSLIRFLHIKPYSDFNKFSIDFSRPMKSSYGEEKDRAMQKLRALLKAILLRRDKKSTIDGKPILDLPERSTASQHAVFSEAEQEFYNALETKSQLQFNKYLKAGTVGRNYSNVLVLLLRLRQACCHPHLIKDFGVPSSAAEATSEDLEKMARELAPDVIARIIEQGDRSDHNGLECPVCMDATENATIFVPCGHNTCSECFARISDPSQAIANGEDGESNLKCPQCRAKIVKTKLTDHVTFKKVHLQRFAVAEEVANELEAADSESDDDTTDDEGSNLGGFIVDDNEETTDDDGDYRKGKTPFERCWNPNKTKSKKEKPSKGKGKAEAKAPKKTLAQLKKESLRNIKAKKKYFARVRKTWESSAKIEQTMEILQATNARKEGEKTIIFSQFTSLLDLLEVPIYDQGLKYQRYDGSMSSNARNDAVMEFTDKPECKIMLVSLRAGNAGLNLVAASQVIILDPFWNPYVEEQAIDRAHRIGQRKPVQVHRILVPGTVEDRILELQEKKRAMIESALDENASKEVSRLGTKELAFLFVSHSRESMIPFIDKIRVFDPKKPSGTEITTLYPPCTLRTTITSNIIPRVCYTNSALPKSPLYNHVSHGWITGT
ncbi:MAG: hypothetical protein LQ349_003644 [Xanthoria aureola]|nr:MAG: hypothetical protein LQ349_003644 [Xanthoria aureola]